MISKLATDPALWRRSTSYHVSARVAMGEYLDSLRGRVAHIVLPAFIGFSEREGSGVFDPVRESGLNVHFYDINDDLTANLKDLSTTLDNIGQPSLCVLIHYFGRTDPSLQAISTTVREHGGFLLEDLAHAYFSNAIGADAGRYGDASIYSLHKMLPMSEGGILKLSTPEGAVDSTRPEIAQVLAEYDTQEIAKRRRRNYNLLHSEVSDMLRTGLPIRPLWSGLGALDVPQTYPVLMPAGIRDSFYDAINAAGYGVVSLYHTLIPELPGRFLTARKISATITNLPVHQDANPDEILQMSQAVRKFISEVRT